MLEQYEKIFNTVLKKVPDHIRDDCYQAASLGLLKALEKKDTVKDLNGYIYSCMKSEVLNEIARLNYPISLDKHTFLLLCKYNNIKNNDLDEELDVSKSRLKNLEMLSRLKPSTFESLYLV